MCFASKWDCQQIMARWLVVAVTTLGCLLTVPLLSWAESNVDVVSRPLVQRSAVQDAQWLIRQPDSRYTLQLVTVSSRGQLQDFADRAAPQVAGTLASFRYQKQNGLLYVMVLGVFATAEEAFQAQRMLQIDGLTAQDTWVRSLDDVKRGIRSTLQD
jgi:septal ring-binding cell division protein DamX